MAMEGDLWGIDPENSWSWNRRENNDKPQDGLGPDWNDWFPSNMDYQSWIIIDEKYDGLSFENLVGGWATPLKNMTSSIGMIIPNPIN